MIGLRAAGIRVVLLDIEGTTSPITFVYDTLFPYARARVDGWLASRPRTDPVLQEIVAGLAEDLRAEGRPIDAAAWDITAATFQPAVVAARVHELMDADRKSRPLKTLQGVIWESGFAGGELKGEVYPDVRPALEGWTGAGVVIGIYSSGSVLAQKLLFAHSIAGDLTPFLRWHFDTAVGAKQDPASYSRILSTLEQDGARVLFLSDVPRELDAARAAGLQTALVVRPPAAPANETSHRVIRSFDDVEP